MTNKSPPAFPEHYTTTSGALTSKGGITRRDYFAAQALAGLCANPGGPFQANGMSGWAITNSSYESIAEECYALADAMECMR